MVESSSDNGVSAHGFREWKATNLRLTIFHSLAPLRPGLWQELRGVAPQIIEVKPWEDIATEQGNVDGNRLVLTARAERHDWDIQPGSDDEQNSAPPTLTDADRMIGVLRNALALTAPKVGQVERLALGCQLMQPISGLTQGMEVLSQYLPHLDLPERGGRDFAYQINRRRPSRSAPDVQVNRVARWSLEEFQKGAIVMGSGQSPVMKVLQAVPLVALTLDINTVPDEEVVPVMSSVMSSIDLFNEMSNLARELASKGDV